MKRLIVALTLGLLGGGAAGFALGIFLYPFWFLNEPADEALLAGVARTPFAVGDFIHVNPVDPVHWGRGSVTLYREGTEQSVVHLHENFEVGPGPRFHVYLVDRGDVSSRADFLGSERFDLGRLRAFKGSQIYAVPTGIDPAKFKSVVVWCKEFDVLISPATLRNPDAKAALAAPHAKAGLD